MKMLDPKQLSERDNYKFLIGAIIPRPIAFITTMSEEGVVNGAPFSFFNIVSSNPPMISVSIQRPAGRVKDTARNIIESKQFVVHIVDTDNVEKINETAANLPPEESEIVRAQLTLVNSKKINVPAIKESKIRFECQLEQALELGGDDKHPGCDLIIGKVLAYHIDEKIYEDGRINPEALAAVSRLAGNDYAEVGNIFTMERPQ